MRNRPASGRNWDVAYPVAIDHALRLDHAVARPDADAIAIGLDAPHFGPFEHLCARSGGSAQDAQTRPIGIELRTAPGTNRTST